jgi:hypothetical protein
MSTQHRADHSLKSSHVLDLIEEAKAVNLKQVNDRIAEEKSALRRDLLACKQQVIAFNARLDVVLPGCWIILLKIGNTSIGTSATTCASLAALTVRRITVLR